MRLHVGTENTFQFKVKNRTQTSFAFLTFADHLVEVRHATTWLTTASAPCKIPAIALVVIQEDINSDRDTAHHSFSRYEA
jgi:hypothetical protein